MTGRYSCWGTASTLSTVGTYQSVDSHNRIVVVYGNNSDICATSYMISNGDDTFMKNGLQDYILDIYIIENLRLERPDDLQGVAMQDSPAISAAVFHRQHGFIYDLCQFVCFGQRHLPFCYRSVSERFFGFVGVFSDNSVFTYSLMMVRAL